ncbi:MAG: cytochrome c3 family protein, partial [Planctomycetota bacterium]|nr:cytochrome c3 family protein [Planctomycetota bacterium]
WEGETAHLLVTPEHFAQDVHWLKEVHCQDCHGGNPQTLNLREAHASEDGFRNIETPADIPNFCGHCHEPSRDTYFASGHGHGLQESGLLATAVCTSCHGAHGIYKADNPKSTLHATHVAQTCAQCHRFIEERLQKSVHGLANGSGGTREKKAPGGVIQRKPSCIDCHQGHDLPYPQSVAARVGLTNRCGDCHDDLAERYSFGLHNELTEVGYAAAANCSDCHGAHEILPLDDAQSPVAPQNRLQTCAQCHPAATANFADIDPHADHRTPERSRPLYYAYVGMEVLLYVVFGLFGLHACLWFARSFVHVTRHGRPQRLAPRQPAYVRFDTVQRVLHVMVIVSFLGLVLTGLPLRYSQQPWAGWLIDALGGFQQTSVWHRLCALLTIFYFVFHLIWLVVKIFQSRARGMPWKMIFLGPDSPVPSARDFKDLRQTVRWFFGPGPKPTYERWTYWEKFDYWAVFWGVAIIGSSGLLLWFPEFFCRFLPGWTVNVAKVIHSELALLATGFVFAIHFFHTHLRPEKFPLDLSIMTGLVSEEEFRAERPAYHERLRREGRLDSLKATAPSARTLWTLFLGGAVALAIGLLLLLRILLAVFGN